MKRADLLALADLMEESDWNEIECDHDLTQFIGFVRYVAQLKPLVYLTVEPHDDTCRCVPLYELSSLED